MMRQHATRVEVKEGSGLGAPNEAETDSSWPRRHIDRHVTRHATEIQQRVAELTGRGSDPGHGMELGHLMDATGPGFGSALW